MQQEWSWRKKMKNCKIKKNAFCAKTDNWKQFSPTSDNVPEYPDAFLKISFFVNSNIDRDQCACLPTPWPTVHHWVTQRFVGNTSALNRSPWRGGQPLDQAENLLQWLADMQNGSPAWNSTLWTMANQSSVTFLPIFLDFCMKLCQSTLANGAQKVIFNLAPEILPETPWILSKLTKHKSCLFLLLNGECPKVRLDRNTWWPHNSQNWRWSHREDFPLKTKVAGHWSWPVTGAGRPLEHCSTFEQSLVLGRLCFKILCKWTMVYWTFDWRFDPRSCTSAQLLVYITAYPTWDLGFHSRAQVCMDN